jgi:hypothetical protein
MKINKVFLVICFAIPIFVVFGTWFLDNTLIAGDLGVSYPSMLNNRSLYPMAWSQLDGSGFGVFAPSLQWVNTTIAIPTILLGKVLGLNWNLVLRLGFLYPFLALVIFSSILLFRKLFPNIQLYLLSGIFILNTYILMVVGGGQVVGLGLAYAIAPLVLYLFINAINKENIKTSLLAGIILSMQLMFDIRIAYITLLAIGIFWLLKIIEVRKLRFIFKSLIFAFIIPGIISLFLHAFWILPTILSHQNPVTQFSSAYTTASAVSYFSFAKFENAIALLHPNWPENIFGKVYFMRPEFLILPILAFASLLFVTSKKLKTENLKPKNDLIIIFFALLALVGAFLAKGSNDPFGGIYLWMFNHVPGFVMFRDSTKFYLLVAISYSVLIPFTVSKIYEWLSSHTGLMIKNRFINLQNLFVILVVGYLLFLIRPALLGQLGGTFKTTTIPAEYTKLEQFLSSQDDFSRTLWMPTQQRFGFYSNNHPAVSAQDLFSIYDNKKLIQKLSSSEKLLQDSSVRYVVVPYDSQGEIFLSDRKYDNTGYLQTITQVKKIPWLIPVSGFGKITVFAVPNAKDHFYITDQKSELTYKYISPVEYSVGLTNAKKGDRVVFAESFDGKWTAKSDSGLTIQDSRFDNRFNSFILPKEGDYNLKIYYTPQEYVNIGVAISLIALVGTLGTLTILVIKKK